MKVLIIGAGNMGMTYGQGMVNSNVVRPANVYVLDKSEEKRAVVGKISTQPMFTEPGEYVGEVDLIILSVKPQDFSRLSESIKPFLNPSQLVLSIMAGVSMKDIEFHLGIPKIIRAMPNLPAQVGRGMTVFTTSAEVSTKEILDAQNLLNTTGKTLYTEKEDMVDAATAISGSGPAFVFYYMQSMIEGAERMGFTPAEALLLVEQTFAGSLQLFQHHNLNCKDWISRVSSRGGTTEAAMKSFDMDHVNALIDKGLEEARKRAVELSKEVGETK